MFEHFGSWGMTWTDRKQRYETIGQLPSCVVIMRTVVVHMDFGSASVTGLFGLLCDAPVQVVNVSEKARINSFYKLAEDRKLKPIMTKVQQDLRREPLEWYERSLRHAKTVYRCCQYSQLSNHGSLMGYLQWLAKVRTSIYIAHPLQYCVAPVYARDGNPPRIAL